MRKNISNSQDGYIVVETTISFMLFLFLIISIITLINIVSLQSKMHFALTQTANELSMYGYLFEVTGAVEGKEKLNERTQKIKGETDGIKNSANGIMNGIENLIGDPLSAEETIYGIGNDFDSIMEQVEAWADNPKEVILNFLSWRANTGMDLIFGEISRAFMKKYLELSTGNGEVDADTFLKINGIEAGIKGLDFYGTEFLRGVGGNSEYQEGDPLNIKLVVKYEIKYVFGALPLPFNTLSVTQTAQTMAWLGGNNKGYHD